MRCADANLRVLFREHANNSLGYDTGGEGDIIMLSPWGEPDDCSAVARIRGKHQLLECRVFSGMFC